MSRANAAEPASDVELVRAMARGDQSALAGLYDRHAARLMGVALRLLADRSEAEDLVQDVLLEAWRRADTFDPGRASVSTWLVVRLRSRALDRLRRRQRKPTLSLEDVGGAEGVVGEAPVAGPGPDQRAAVALLATLPPAQREVLELACFGGLSGREIAEAVGVPLGTVKSRTAAALRALRAGLEEAT